MDTKILLSSPVQMAAYRKHRRQAFWRIFLPVILASLILVAVTVFLIITTGDPGNQVDSKWASISLIWLALPTILASLILMAIVGGLVFLMAKLLNVMPELSAKGQYYAARMAQIARSVGDKAVNPVMKAKSGWAGWQQFRKDIRQFRIF